MWDKALREEVTDKGGTIERKKGARRSRLLVPDQFDADGRLKTHGHTPTWKGSGLNADSRARYREICAMLGWFRDARVFSRFDDGSKFARVRHEVRPVNGGRPPAHHCRTGEIWPLSSGDRSKRTNGMNQSAGAA